VNPLGGNRGPRTRGGGDGSHNANLGGGHSSSGTLRDQEQGSETELVRPRYTQSIPGRYAAMLVRRRRLPPGQAYLEIMGAIQAQNEVEVCRDEVTWIQAA
jgi:hypothetical protein